MAEKPIEREELSRLFDAGREKGANLLLVVERDGEIEPLYLYSKEDGGEGMYAPALKDPDYGLFSRWSLRKVLQIYHLGMDKDVQLETRDKQAPLHLHIHEDALKPAEKALPAIGSWVKIKDDADGSGEMAQGLFAKVTAHTTGSMGMKEMILAQIVGGPTEKMWKAGITSLDLYADEYWRVTIEGT